MSNPHASFASAAYSPDGLLAGGIVRSRKVTVANGAGPLARGTVLGQVTASGKYLPSLAAADDGSEAPDLVLAADVDASAADAEALAYYTGDFSALALTIGAGHTVVSIREGLRVKGINIIGVAA